MANTDGIVLPHASGARPVAGLLPGGRPVGRRIDPPVHAGEYLLFNVSNVWGTSRCGRWRGGNALWRLGARMLRRFPFLCNANGWKPGRNWLEWERFGNLVWASCPVSGMVTSTNTPSVRTTAVLSLNPILSLFTPSFGQRPLPLSTSYPILPGRTAAGCGKRPETNWHEQPISIYELHLGSWKGRPTAGRFSITASSLPCWSITRMRWAIRTFSSCRSPSTPSMARGAIRRPAISPQPAGNGTPPDFMYFVDYCHQPNVGVLVDWVPAHFPTDGHALGHFDGTAMYEDADPRQGLHPDWETHILITAATRSAIFCCRCPLPARCISHGWIRVDAVASMLYLDYSRGSGSPTNTADAKTSRRSSSSKT